jgi:peptidoglycan/LPS O-acetylase OafA/YrhL
MNRIRSLAGLRGVAAYSVLLAHIIDVDCKGDALVHNFSARLAYFSMSLFFVLSGFVIHYNYAQMLKTTSGIVDFFVARFARLYPLYLVIIIFYAAQHLNVATTSVIASHATLTQSWFNTQEAFFAPTWSISTEWFFYVGFVGIAASGLLARINDPVRCAFLFILIVIATLCIVFLFRVLIVGFISGHSFGLFYHGAVSAPAWYWLTYYSPLLRFFEFGVGVMISLMHRRGSLKISNLIGFSAVAWCLLVIVTEDINDEFMKNFQPNFVYAPAIAIIILYSCQQGNPVSWLLGMPAIVWTGEISYSVYLFQFICHGISLLIVNFVIVDIMLTIVITTIVASLSYRFIEVPARRCIQRRVREYQTIGAPRRVSL